MSKIIGRQIEIGVASEAVRGTAEAAPSHWIKKQNADLIPRAEHAIDEMTFGKLEDSEKRRVVRKWLEGDLGGNVHVDVIGWFFYNIFGQVTSSSLGDGAYEHEFTIEQSTVHPTLSFFVKDGDVDQYVVNGAMIQSLELTAEQNTYLSYTASLIGRDYDTDAATPSYSPENDFIGRDITIKIANTEGDLATAEAIKVKNVTLTFEPNVEANFILGDRLPEDIHNKQWSLSGEFESDYQDNGYLAPYLGDFAVYMLITIEGEADIGGGEKPTVQFLLNKVQIMDWTRADSANELIQQTISFKAFYNDEDESMITATVINNTEEYEPVISA